MEVHNVVFSSMMDFYHVYLSNLSIQFTKSSGDPTFEASPCFESLFPSMVRPREGLR